MSLQTMDEFTKTWVQQVEEVLLPPLRIDSRFPDAERLIGRFNANVETWRSGGSVKALAEDANELGVAYSLLKEAGSEEIFLRYEPPLKNTNKTIDFLIERSSGERSWIDVKTVAPLWRDDDASWQRFLVIAADFPDNAHYITHRDWLGAGLSGQEIKSRWTFIARTLDVEHKASLLTADERGPVRLLLCSNGAFHEDALEDFADFYHTGKFRSDDAWSNAIARYMRDENISFARSLAGFCYLKRDAWEVLPEQFVLDVHGPVLGR